MTARRLLCSDTWSDEFFTSLCYLDRLIWIGLITGVMDDQGRALDNAALIRSKIFPVDDIPLSDIENALDRFLSAGKIARYIAGSKRAIQIVNWWRHQQSQWAGKSNIEPPPGWTDRMRYHGKGNAIITLNWEKQGGYIDGYIDGYIPPLYSREHSREVKVKGEVKGEGEVKVKVKGEVEVAAAAAFRAYEQNIGVITPVIAGKIESTLETIPAEWIIEALEIAATQNKRNWAYAAAIIRRWEAQGKDNGSKPPEKQTAYVGPDGEEIPG